MLATEQGGRSKRARKRWATGAQPPSPFIVREGQPAPLTIGCNDGFACMSQGLVKSGSCRGSVGKRRRPRPINRHASTKAACYWGPAALHTCPFASLLSQVRVRLGPRGYCQRPGNGGPQTCLPAAHGVAVLAGLYGPSSSTRHSRPSRGAMPRKVDDARPPQERPSQAGSRGAEISRRGKTSRGSRDVSHDEGHQAGARWAPARAASLFPLWC